MPLFPEEHNLTINTDWNSISILFGPAEFIRTQLPITAAAHVTHKIETIAVTAPTNGWLYITILWNK